MYIISKEEYENLPEEKKAEYHKETAKYHELMKFHIDHTVVRQRQIESEILTLINEHVNLKNHHYTEGIEEMLCLQRIQVMINDYIEVQRKAYEEFYSPKLAQVRNDKIYKAIDDRHKEIYSKNKQESN